MNKIQSIIAYICLNYPHRSELTNARLTKMVYLADWFSALLDNKQLTDITWVFNHYGPYVDDVINSANYSPYFRIEHEYTSYGTSKHVVSYNGPADNLRLTPREKQIIDTVIDKTQALYFNQFIDYVYSTYPVRAKERYSHFNLIALANDYKSFRHMT